MFALISLFLSGFVLAVAALALVPVSIEGAGGSKNLPTAGSTRLNAKNDDSSKASAANLTTGFAA